MTFTKDQRVWFILFNFKDSDHFTSVVSGVVLKQYGDLYQIGYDGKERWIWKKRLFVSEDQLDHYYKLRKN